MLSAGKNTGCRLTVEQNRILGELHIPKKPHQQETHIVFTWWNSNLLFVDPDGEAANVWHGSGKCVRIMRMEQTIH